MHVDRELKAYMRAVRKELRSGQATEHSYRPALKTLIEALGPTGIQAVNEPTQGEYGAPDFIVHQNGVPVGHVECKNIGADLDEVEQSAQLQRYRDALPNLILTDYVEFRWYVDGELQSTGKLARSSDEKLKGRPTMTVGAIWESFFNADGIAISNPAELAQRMAGKTRLLREHIRGILDEDNAGVASLSQLLESYREVLISQLSADQFADLQAQTIAYGLFAARWLYDGAPQTFNRQAAAFAQTTPFLRDVFGRVAGPSADPRITWIIDDLARLLSRTDMAAILEDFGKRTKREDPAIHFYEDFLAAYDQQLKVQHGVYYTPEPVVSYIVRSVNLLLRREFGLADGLADTSTVETKSENGETRSSPRVLILDPAAGTGSFLREVIAVIRSDLEQRGLGGAWPDYVQQHLLPRLFGFELLMAPYAIAHLKLALEIGGDPLQFTRPANGRLNVFLTNALEEAHGEAAQVMFGAEIAREARQADAVKRDRPVMVVIGNPPYAGHSANKGKWIRDLAADYKAGIPELQKPGKAKWLSDDYVKFIRFAQWRIERTGEGVLGFITNHSYLDNPTFRGMRQSLMRTFDEIYILDLHGNAKKKEQPPDGGLDQNVFDIQQGVAIALFVKRSGGREDARVFHEDVWGDRDEKQAWLASNDVATVEWTELSPKSAQYLFAPRDEALIDEYQTGWPLPAVFAPYGDPAPGIVTTQDQFAISWTAADAVSKVERFLATKSEEEARSIWRLCSQDQWQYERAKDELANNDWRSRVEPVLYRPFDIRTTVYDRNVAVHRRERVMRHMRAGPNLGLSTTARIEIAAGYDHVFATTGMMTHHAVSLKEGNYLFPLYVYADPCDMEIDVPDRSPNLAPEFIAEAAAALDLEFTPDGPGDLETAFGPEDVFHYIYAILHSPEYRSRYADFLKSDFPRVPLPDRRRGRYIRRLRRELFAQLVELGARLAALHLMEATGYEQPKFSARGTDLVDKVRYVEPADGDPGRVYINATQHFEGVAPETWEFTIGGYQPAQKWLKDRKGRELSYDDIAHYQRICAALAETPKLMSRIDEVVEQHGGWPLSAPSETEA